MPEIDLTNCDRERIHEIGHIQPHGVLVALDPATLIVTHASASAEAFFGIAAETLLGRSFGDLLPSKSLEIPDGIEDDPTHLGTSTVNDRGPFHLVAHLREGVLIVEAESHEPNETHDYGTLPRKLLKSLQVADGSQAFYETVVREARALTGFDRVMLYRFAEDGSGVVVAEDAEPHLEPYLGLNYPASDIPQQARRLFALNTVRLYPDIDYAPSAIVSHDDRLLDMTYCALRGVSSMHTQYLRNMGVRASMALAITRGEDLWGLVALHHYAPRALSYPLRASCELLAGLASMQVLEKEASEDRKNMERRNATLDRLVRKIGRTPRIPATLAEGDETILDLIDASGAALVLAGEIRLLGTTPPEAAVKRIVEKLEREQLDPVWSVDERATPYPEAVGLLSVQISRAVRGYALWFRPETRTTVNWAGDPNKPVEPSEDGDRLSPRRSFALWQQTVEGRSRPWTPSETEMASRLRLALVEALVSRTDEILNLNAELERRNQDLDTFAHVAAHDLKEPLRGIRNYAQFLEEDYGEKIDEEGKAQIATIVRLSGRMETLLDSLLRFARLTREELGTSRCELGTVVAEAQALVASAIARTNGRIAVEGTLPEIAGDEHLLTEAFVNLFTNALKYNDSPSPEIVVEALRDEGRVIVSVRDNGIGIPERHQEAVFTLFKRLHAKDAFGGGTGMGLTIVKRAVERLGGTVWVRSSPGQGCTFFLDLPA